MLWSGNAATGDIQNRDGELEDQWKKEMVGMKKKMNKGSKNRRRQRARV